MTTTLHGDECLGCGYDVFGEYASPISTITELFELGPQDTKVKLGAK